MEQNSIVRLHLRAAIGGLTPEEVCKYLEVIFKECTFTVNKKPTEIKTETRDPSAGC